MEDEKMKMKF